MHSSTLTSDVPPRRRNTVPAEKDSLEKRHWDVTKGIERSPSLQDPEDVLSSALTQLLVINVAFGAIDWPGLAIEEGPVEEDKHQPIEEVHH